MKWTATHVQTLLWLAFQEVKTRSPNAKLIAENWPETNGGTPSPRAVSEKLFAIKNGVEELGLAEFFGLSASGGKPAPIRNKSSSARARGVVLATHGVQHEHVRRMSPPSIQLQIDDVSSTQRQIEASAPSNGEEKKPSFTQRRIATPAPSNGDGEDDGIVAESDIDGETATESETESSVIVIQSQAGQKRANGIKSSSQESEVGDVIFVKSQPVRHHFGPAKLAGSSRSSSQCKSQAVEDFPPLPMKLRSLPKRTYKNSPDLDFGDDEIEPDALERVLKKPRHHGKSPTAETCPSMWPFPGNYETLSYIPTLEQA